MKDARRRVGIALVIAPFVALGVFAVLLRPSDHLSPVDEPREWAAAEWRDVPDPPLLSPARPKWPEENGIKVAGSDRYPNSAFAITHLPAVLGVEEFSRWDATVDIVREGAPGDSFAPLADGGKIVVSHFDLSLPRQSSVESSPVCSVRFEQEGVEIAEVRNIRIGCARVGRFSSHLLRDTYADREPDGSFIAQKEVPFWHSIDPVIIADVVYDCGDPTPIAFEQNAQAQLGDTEVTLLATASESLFLRGQKPNDAGALVNIITQSRTDDFVSLVAATQPLQPPRRLLFEARLKSGDEHIGRMHFCPPLHNAAIQTYRVPAKIEDLDQINVRLARRIDRIVIRLPRFRSPAEPTEEEAVNLFDLRAPFVHSKGGRELARVLGDMTQCQVEVDPNSSISFGGTGMIMRDITGHELYEELESLYGRVEHDPKTHTLTFGGDPTWMDNLIAQIQQLLEKIKLR